MVLKGGHKGVQVRRGGHGRPRVVLHLHEGDERGRPKPDAAL
jgi:hypothetical protein